MRKTFFFLLAVSTLLACGGGNSTSTSSKSSDTTGGSTANPACTALTTGSGTSLGGFVPFPSANAWNQDISSAAVDSNSTAIISSIGTGTSVHADFGAGTYSGIKIGIPYVIVDATQSFVPITFTSYGAESDPGPMPVPASGPIEGDPMPGTGDRHVLVLSKDNCFLYELYGAYPGSNGAWSAASAAVWDMTATTQRPYLWTSADAAGLPVFPGLARYDEVAAGKISHALRFTVSQTRAAFVAPASHWASSSTSTSLPPMGTRLRLKSSFDISSYSAANQVILKALKQYGMILADNGSSIYISGAPDDRWDNTDLSKLGALKGSDFEVVQMGNIYTSSNIPAGSPPTISSFSANPTTTNATSGTTLSWSATNASYYVMSPDVGAVRGTSVTVKPSTTTTYTLYAANAYGRVTATTTVTVQ